LTDSDEREAGEKLHKIRADMQRQLENRSMRSKNTAAEKKRKTSAVKARKEAKLRKQMLGQKMSTRIHGTHKERVKRGGTKDIHISFKV
jgi:hypothetical protein